MGGSLQDQLIQSGLVSEERAKELEKNKRRTHRKGKGGPAGRKKTSAKGGKRSHKKSGQSDLARAYAIRAQTERREKAELEAQRKEEAARRKKAKAALKKITSEHALNDKDAEVARNFEYRGRIKRVYVTAQQQQALSEEKLGIAMVAGRSYLLPLEAIAEVEKVQPEAVAWPRADDQESASDDEYAEHQVPDDLMW